MTILCGAVLKDNLILVSRSFVSDLSRLRCEALLSQFFTLDGESRRAMVEINSIRYLSAQCDEYILLLVTDRTSNVFNDFATLSTFTQAFTSICETNKPTVDVSLHTNTERHTERETHTHFSIHTTGCNGACL